MPELALYFISIRKRINPEVIFLLIQPPNLPAIINLKESIYIVYMASRIFILSSRGGWVLKRFAMNFPVFLNGLEI